MPMLTTVRIGLAGGAEPTARAHIVGKDPHLLEDRVDRRHDIDPVDLDGGVRAVAQGDVEHGTILGPVDRGAREHLAGGLVDSRRRSELAEELDGLSGDSILREVEEAPDRDRGRSPRTVENPPGRVPASRGGRSRGGVRRARPTPEPTRAIHHHESKASLTESNRMRHPLLDCVGRRSRPSIRARSRPTPTPAPGPRP